MVLATLDKITEIYSSPLRIIGLWSYPNVLAIQVKLTYIVMQDRLDTQF